MSIFLFNLNNTFTIKNKNLSETFRMYHLHQYFQNSHRGACPTWKIVWGRPCLLTKLTLSLLYNENDSHLFKINRPQTKAWIIPPWKYGKLTIMQRLTRFILFSWNMNRVNLGVFRRISLTVTKDDVRNKIF